MSGALSTDMPAAEEQPTSRPRHSWDSQTASRLAETTVLLDCRWLGSGGTGRVTELLLSELRDAPPPGEWKLWGDPERVALWAFPGASIIPWSGDPTRWFGQADLLRVPANDVAVYLHQVRPLRPGRSITFVHDTIPVRLEPHRALRSAKRFFFRLACRLSARIITVSARSRDSIVRDLAVPRSKVIIASLTVDARRVERIRSLRRSATREDEIVYVGRFAEHKNLRRLCRAFQSTALHRRGGRLVLVGGSNDEVTAMSTWLGRNRLTGVDVRGRCSESELEELLANCRALVQPSLEEGYGLPAVEAAAVGVQVAASRTGYAPEIPPELITFMDPLDEASIASAIDAAAARPDSELTWLPRSTVREVVVGAVMQLSVVHSGRRESGR
jgi:glycosyltransferase involved in cell wall biosynthesis